MVLRIDEHDSSPLSLPEQVISAYRAYLTKCPLDLAEKPLAVQTYWKENYQYSLLRYNQLLAVLLKSKSLDDFVRASASDFDNIAPFLQSLIEAGIVNIDQGGTVIPLVDFESDDTTCAEQVSTIDPRQDFNQFPCDHSSRQRRHAMLKDRYPHAKKVRVGIVGDDDLLSIELAADPKFETLVLEKDPRIVDLIGQYTQQQCKLLTVDVIDVKERDTSTAEKVQTFITDPPYTLNGALAFIKAGLSIMHNNGEQKEFYVVLNPTMMGKKMAAMLRILTLAGITLTHVVENFSQYKLPVEFDERRRANEFLAGHSVSEDALQYSSSSNLYVFTVQGGDAVQDLTEYIDVSRLYEHYED